jgi:hypothetical protein
MSFGAEKIFETHETQKLIEHALDHLRPYPVNHHVLGRLLLVLTDISFLIAVTCVSDFRPYSADNCVIG